ncbi:MAG: type III secretion system chaperone [Kiritimatiellae bacterium]|nr:type III secretion system chaperone [Kiritimatiellia bacterium]
MTFGRLIEAIGGRLGLEIADEGGAAAVEVDGSTVVLQQANDDLLLVHVDLGEVPGGRRDEVVSAAMEANFLYQGTGGATLSVDSRDGHLHLQKYNWLERLDAESGFETVVKFAETARTWKRFVADAAGASRQFGGVPFMKV